MKPLKRLFPAALFLLLLAACAAPLAFGAEAEKNPAEEPIGEVFKWLNFALVFGAAGYFIAKKAPAVFRKRAEAVTASITEAAAAKAEAERQLRETEGRLARLNEEIDELRAAAQREAAAEAERIRARAREEAAKIDRAAEAEIEAAGRAARMELKAIAARVAVERADALIRQRLNRDAQSRLFQSFLGDLARRAN